MIEQKEIENTSGFYAIIPAPVLYDKLLPYGCRLLYGIISAYCNQEGYCWATNAKFAQLFDMSTSSISKWISMLVNHGHVLTSDYKRPDGSVQRRIYLAVAPMVKISHPHSKNLLSPSEKNTTPLAENSHHNSIDNNKTDNILLNNKVKEIAIPEQWDSTQYLKEWNRFAEYMHELKKKRMPTSTINELTQQLIYVSKGDFETAKKIISRTIIKRYDQFYELPKDNKKPDQKFDDEYYK